MHKKYKYEVKSVKRDWIKTAICDTQSEADKEVQFALAEMEIKLGEMPKDATFCVYPV